MHLIRHTGAALAAAALLIPLSATAQVSVNIHVPGVVMVAPPPPRMERLPPPRGGSVWVPGHWAWSGNAYVWQAGVWRPERPGYAYAPGRWVQAPGGWRWVEGDWKPHHGGKRAKHDRHGGEGHGGGHHCPPGQARKGNC